MKLFLFLPLGSQLSRKLWAAVAWQENAITIHRLGKWGQVLSQNQTEGDSR
jgi:hypothetical protein